MERKSDGMSCQRYNDYRWTQTIQKLLQEKGYSVGIHDGRIQAVKGNKTINILITKKFISVREVIHTLYDNYEALIERFIEF